MRDISILEWIKNNASPEIKNYADGTKTLVLYDDCSEDKIEICLPVILWDKVKEWLKNGIN